MNGPLERDPRRSPRQRAPGAAAASDSWPCIRRPCSKIAALAAFVLIVVQATACSKTAPKKAPVPTPQKTAAPGSMTIDEQKRIAAQVEAERERKRANPSPEPTPAASGKSAASEGPKPEQKAWSEVCASKSRGSTKGWLQLEGHYVIRDPDTGGMMVLVSGVGKDAIAAFAKEQKVRVQKKNKYWWIIGGDTILFDERGMWAGICL